MDSRIENIASLSEVVDFLIMQETEDSIKHQQQQQQQQQPSLEYYEQASSTLSSVLNDDDFERAEHSIQTLTRCILDKMVTIEKSQQDISVGKRAGIRLLQRITTEFWSNLGVEVVLDTIVEVLLNLQGAQQKDSDGSHASTNMIKKLLCCELISSADFVVELIPSMAMCHSLHRMLCYYTSPKDSLIATSALEFYKKCHSAEQNLISDKQHLAEYGIQFFLDIASWKHYLADRNVVLRALLATMSFPPSFIVMDPEDFLPLQNLCTDNDVPDIILTIMRKYHARDAQVQKACVRVLLYCMHDVWDDVVDGKRRDYVEAIVEAIANHPNDAGVQWAMTNLWCSMTRKGGIFPVQNEDEMDRILRSISDYGSSDEDYKNAAQVFFKFLDNPEYEHSSHEDKDSKIVFSFPIANLLSDMLMSHATDVRRLVAVFKFFSSISDFKHGYDFDFCKNDEIENFIGIFLETMSRHPRSPGLQLSALKAINSLVDHVDYISDAYYFRDDGRTQVFAIMRDFSQDARIQKECCDLFSRHCWWRAPEDLQDDRITLLFNALRNHAGDVGVQNSVLALWDEITEDWQSVDERFVDELAELVDGLAPLVLQAVCNHDSFDVHVKAMSVLRTLQFVDYRGTRRISQAVLDSHCLPLLLKSVHDGIQNEQRVVGSPSFGYWFSCFNELMHELYVWDSDATVPAVTSTADGVSIVSKIALCCDDSKFACKLARIPAADGRLPLHIVASHAIISMQDEKRQVKVAGDLLDEFPDAAHVADGIGRLPLHCAIESNAPPKLVSLLLNVNSRATMVRDSRGLLPIQLSIQSHSCWEVFEAVFQANPTFEQENGVSRTDSSVFAAASNNCELGQIYFLLRNNPSVLENKTPRKRKRSDQDRTRRCPDCSVVLRRSKRSRTSVSKTTTPN